MNESDSNVNYSVDNSTPIEIKVSGGQTTSNADGDYFTFADTDDNPISLADGSFRFMRGRTYKFVADGIDSSHPFYVYANGTGSSSLTGTGGNVEITLASNHSVTAGGLYYQCSNHSIMRANLTILHQSVAESGESGNGDYDFYYGDVTLTVGTPSAPSYYSTISYYCFHHGYMGGKDNLVFNINCP